MQQQASLHAAPRGASEQRNRRVSPAGQTCPLLPHLWAVDAATRAADTAKASLYVVIFDMLGGGDALASCLCWVWICDWVWTEKRQLDFER